MSEGFYLFMSFFLTKSNGWKSFSIRSIIINSSLLTNLLNSDSSAEVVLVSLSISWFSFRLFCLISFISLSIFDREEIRFLPRRRTRSLISLFRSSRSRSLVLKSDSRNLT